MRKFWDFFFGRCGDEGLGHDECRVSAEDVNVEIFKVMKEERHGSNVGGCRQGMEFQMEVLFPEKVLRK